MRKYLVPMAVCLVLGACGYVSEYEKGVYDYEPVYCYQSLGGVQCFDTPNHRDERRMVNYYGPSPTRYDKPAPPPTPQFFAPPPIDFFVRDPEPVPEPVPLRMAPVTRLPEAETTVSFAADATLPSPVFPPAELTVSEKGLSALPDPAVSEGVPGVVPDEPPFLP